MLLEVGIKSAFRRLSDRKFRLKRNLTSLLSNSVSWQFDAMDGDVSATKSSYRSACARACTVFLSILVGFCSRSMRGWLVTAFYCVTLRVIAFLCANFNVLS